MKPKYYLTQYDREGEAVEHVEFTEFDKETIQAKLDEICNRLKEGETVDYWKANDKEQVVLLSVDNVNGSLKRCLGIVNLKPAA